jgi:hypothetical protein
MKVMRIFKNKTLLLNSLTALQQSFWGWFMNVWIILSTGLDGKVDSQSYKRKSLLAMTYSPRRLPSKYHQR